MNIDEATELVICKLKADRPDSALLQDGTAEYSDYFVFYYQSKKYIETRRFDDMYVGQGPIIVCKKTGEVFETGSAHSAEHYIETLRACGSPFGELTCEVKITGWHKGADKVLATKYLKVELSIGLSEAKCIIDDVLSNKECIFTATSIAHAKTMVNELKERGVLAQQIWSVSANKSSHSAS